LSFYRSSSILAQMDLVEKIKEAAIQLDADKRYELFRWWIESNGFQQRQLAALKQDIATGIKNLESGQYEEYNDEGLMRLAESIGERGRIRLAMERKSRVG